MKTSEAFRLTKVKVWDGKNNRSLGQSSYICFAASNALRKPGQVTKVIEKLLDGHASMHSWLIAQGCEPWQEVSQLRIQTTRHAWLDHLIEHYKSIGD